MDSKAPDAVIIGAGHNSLACGLHLLAKGWRVLLLEQASEPGGAVKTRERTLPGFRHDWAAMNLSLFAGSAFFGSYGEELAQNGLSFTPVAVPFATAFPDGRWMGITSDAEANLARIEAFSAEDAKTWQVLTNDFPEQAGLIVDVLGSPMKMRAIASIAFSTWRKKGAAGALTFGVIW